jgi:phosphotransferase system HPr (HPr) family protein
MSVESIITATFKVLDPGGLHVRPAARIAFVAALNPGPVTAFCRQTVADAKDRLDLLLLAAGPGDEVTFTLAGPRAPAVADQLRRLFERKFLPN